MLLCNPQIAIAVLGCHRGALDNERLDIALHSRKGCSKIVRDIRDELAA